MNSRPGRAPLSARRWLRGSGGPLLTLACAAAAESLRATTLHFPGPGIPLLVAVAWSAYAGGFVSGTVSAALATGYAVYTYGTSPPEGLSLDEVRRLADFALGALSLVVMLGLLRRRAERARRLAGDAAVALEHHVVLEEAADPLLLTDPTGRCVFVNQRACEMTGYSREELLRMRIGDLFAADGGAADTIASSSPEPRHIDVDLVRRDGTRLRTELSVRRLSDGRTLEIVHDVTERRASMERLASALSLVRATLESTTDGILVVDREGRWVDHNARFRDIWRIPGEIAQAGDDARALEHVVGQLADPGGFAARVRELYSTPEASSHDEIFLRDGRVLERYSLPQRIGERTIGRVWNFRDVTGERRRAEELCETERRFIQAEKQEAVGRLSGSVAHDFNNMLTAILGEADLLLVQASLDERPRAQVENIRNAAQRSAALTRQLLTLTRRQHTEPRQFALCELLEGLDPLIRRLAGRNVAVRVDLPRGGSGPWVHADPAQFEQAILNLVINAGDAMPDGGSLVLSLCRDAVTEADAARRGAPAPGRYACVCVEDTGTGIPDDVRAHIFEPFFTTKPPGKGTGLGLASVHGIVQQANGFVEVASEVGRGTTFRVLVPEFINGQGGAPDAGEDPTASASLPAASVLVVDDEEHVRCLVVTVLSNAGYDVLHAGSAAAALALALERPGMIDLLLCDVLMPGVNGPDLARTLIAQGRVRRVMFMSGYPGAALESDLGDLSRVALVHKPFHSDELQEQVRLVLEGVEATLPR